MTSTQWKNATLEPEHTRTARLLINVEILQRPLTSEMEEKINQSGQVEWNEILETVEHDELVYKLTLKYLRQDGYDIGDWKRPRVIKTILGSTAQLSFCDLIFLAIMMGVTRRIGIDIAIKIVWI